jgi:WD40 repeat protein
MSSVFMTQFTSAFRILLSVLIFGLATASSQAADPADEKKSKELNAQADQLKVKEQASQKVLEGAQKKAIEIQSMLTKLKADINRAEKAVKDAEAKVKPEQAKITKADAAKKAADAAFAAIKKTADAAKKAADAALAKSKAEEVKAQAAAKALLAAQDVLKKVQATITTAKATLTTSKTGLDSATKAFAAFKPSLDKATADFTASRKQHIDVRRAAEQHMIKIGQLVSFAEKVAPIFAKRCLACHNAKTAKGRYNMETFAGIMKGGESGDSVVVGKPDDSNVFALIESGDMPKDADPLTKDQLASIKRWIETGAILDAGFSASSPLIAIMPKEIQPKAPESYPVPIPVTAVAFNHDGTQLATSGYHEVIVWNTADGKLLNRITNVAERVYDLEFTKDGKTLVIASGTPAQIGEVKLFNVADGKLLGDLVRTDDSVFGIAVSPDGKRLASAGADRSIRIFDIATQKEEVLIEDHADWVMDIAWSPDGAKLASASRDKTSKVFDTKTGDSLVTFNGHGQPVYGVAFSPDGKLVVTSGSDKNIRTWAVGTAKQVRAIGGFGNEVFRIAITPAGHVYSCSADKTARVHQVADGKALRTYAGHTDWVYSVAVHPGTKRVAAGSYNGEVRIWNLDDAKELVKFVAAPGLGDKTTAAK